MSLTLRTSTGQNEHESYRLIVLARHGAEVLLVRNGERFMLRSVEIPRWQRIAENLTAAFKTDWGADVVCLFELPMESADHLGITQYQAAEHLHTCSNPKMPTRWIPVSVLYQGSFTEECDYAAIKQVVGVCKGDIEGESAGPFARLGWFRESREWIESTVEPIGFHLNGEFRQLNASPAFSLIRFETNGPALVLVPPDSRQFQSRIDALEPRRANG